jgi:hypothetical protein
MCYTATAAVTFQDVEPKFWRTVNSFLRTFPTCDADSVTSAAFDGFLKAYDQYDPGYGKSFDNYMVRRVWSAMWTEWRNRVTYRRRYHSAPLLKDTAAVRPAPEFAFAEWLTDDEKEVIKVVLDMPREVARTVKRLGDKPHNVRYAVRCYMRGMGWGINRTAKAFNGIKNLL